MTCRSNAQTISVLLRRYNREFPSSIWGMDRGDGGMLLLSPFKNAGVHITTYIKYKNMCSSKEMVRRFSYCTT